MKRVLDALLPRVRAGEGVSIQEVNRALVANHPDLTAAWVGTTDEPGVLARILQAGQAAGQAALTRGSAANPNRPVALKADLGLDINWQLVPAEARDFVERYAFDLIRELDNTTREELRKLITEWLRVGGSVDDLKRQLTTLFNDPARALNIATTESTRAFFEGTKKRYSDAGVSEMKWYTVRDQRVCKICRELNDTVGTISDGWYSDVLGRNTFIPSHPGCRCYGRAVIPETF